MALFGNKKNKNEDLDVSTIDKYIAEVLEYRQHIQGLYNEYLEQEAEIWDGTDGGTGKYSHVLTTEKAVELAEKLADETGEDIYTDEDLLGEFFNSLSDPLIETVVDAPDGLYALFSYNPERDFDETDEEQRLKEWSDLVKGYAGIDGETGEALPWYFVRSIPSWFAGDVVSDGPMIELLDWCIHNMERYEAMSEQKTIDPYDILGERDFEPLRHPKDAEELARNEKAMQAGVQIAKNANMILEDLIVGNNRIIDFYNAQEEIEQNADKLFIQFLEKKGISQK